MADVPQQKKAQLSRPTGRMQQVGKSGRVRDRNSAASVRPQPRSRSNKGQWFISMLTISGLLAGAALVVGGGWVGIQLMVDPNALSWANRFLPGSMQIPISNQQPVQTIAEIQAEIRALKLIPGEAIFLPTQHQFSVGNAAHLVVPVQLDRPQCQYQCQQIVELRVYAPVLALPLPGQEETYRLVSQVAVQGIEESLVLAPLQGTGVARQSTNRLLPLTDLNLFEGNVPNSGVWLYLSGQRLQGDRTIAYGHVIHYNPDRTFLNLMLQWASPTGKPPTWQAMTGGELPELAIDRTVGMEPNFQLYQIQPLAFPADPIQLQFVSLDEPALGHPAYRQALRLARSGLWSDGLRSLQSFKVKQKTDKQIPWTAAAQAQMELIRLHAEVTQAQATQAWVSPSQQLLAKLIDGRWNEALKLLQANPDRFQDAIALLNSNADRLLSRVEAAQEIDSAQNDARIWGTLILAAQKGRPQAVAWLRQQPGNAGTSLSVVNPILNRQETANLTAAIPQHSSQIVGAAHRLGQVNLAGWQQPSQNKPLTSADGYTWYQVEVAHFQDGERWQRLPIKMPQLSPGKAGDYLWRLLGLDVNNQIDVLLWTAAGRQHVSATVRALRLDRGQLWLLATAKPDSSIPSTRSSSLPHPFAFTANALRWLTPPTTTLAELSQQQPQAVAALVPALWRELQQADYLSSADLPPLEQKLQRLGALSVQRIDLTGNQQPDTVVMLSAAVLARLQETEAAELLAEDPPPSKTHTAIFSAGGRLLYSEFSDAAGQSAIAIATLSDGDLPVLVIDGPHNYSLKRWSTPNQRFQ